MDTIRNPLEWGRDVLKFFGRAAQLTSRSIEGVEDTSDNVTPKICQIEIADFKEILAKGLKDFGAGRTDVIFICIIYPVVGFLLIQFAFERNVLPLLFPLASGFALIAPLTAVGLYEMSRRREQGLSATWADAFRALQSPSFGAMFALGLFLIVIFMLWLGAAQVIYWATLGPEAPTSITTFVTDVLTTGAGWAMIIMGVGVGFCFAVVVLAASVVSFPMLLDHDVGLRVAIETSVRAVAANPRPMAAWGIIVAGGLALGTIPAFLGLIIILPVLGHSTWHLYRKLVTY